jgi:hypothetical protein
MRPIVSNNDATTEKISKWLCDEFSKIPDPTEFFGKNTHAFLEKLKDVSIEQDECMVSFDITALFPNFPIDIALHLLKKWLKMHLTNNDKIKSNVFTNKTMELVWETHYHHCWQIYSWRISKQNYQN